MATIKVTEEVELMLSKLQENSTKACRKALYEGAKVLADYMKTEIENLPTDDRSGAGAGTFQLNGIKKIQKRGLIESFGVAPFRENDGTISTHLGFDGYNNVKTATFPNGQPNSMIARSVNSGTYFMQATPFIDRTRRQHAKAEERMEEVIREEVQKETF